jgi:excisionase family DNA binding protein
MNSSVAIGSSAPPVPTDRPTRGAGWLTVVEAAEWIGVGRTTAYALIDAREIATIRVGRKVFVPIESLEAYRQRKIGELGSAPPTSETYRHE